MRPLSIRQLAPPAASQAKAPLDDSHRAVQFLRPCEFWDQELIAQPSLKGLPAIRVSTTTSHSLNPEKASFPPCDMRLIGAFFAFMQGFDEADWKDFAGPGIDPLSELLRLAVP